MKDIFTLFIAFCVFPSILFGQSIDVFGGANINYFYDLNNGMADSQYQKGNGYSFGFGIQKFFPDSIPFRFDIGLDYYNGCLSIYNGMVGGGTLTNAETGKYSIMLGIYPLNFQILKRKILINFGGRFSYLLKETTTGFQSESTPSSYTLYSLDDGDVKINNNFNFGISCRFAYLLNIYKGLSLTPQYLLFIGLTNDFRNIGANTKSLRHIFAIGITKNIE
ncbi:MAG: hypothetical protein J7L46_02950 [Bacteroidales bacterium]|nr:hypothetical protein [Bacteroidales bacterium]